MDEIDAIGGRRFSEGNSSDREIQRTLMELLNQLDGFETRGQVKIIMATNRPDTLDPALLRPGRLDRKIEIPLPNEQGRLDILKIHSASIAKHGDIGTQASELFVSAQFVSVIDVSFFFFFLVVSTDYEAVTKLTDGFNGADLRNVCTEAGMFAIRDQRDYVVQEDFMKAARKIMETKKLEGSLDYEKV
jgi:26S proteasome regulatory subunit T4